MKKDNKEFVKEITAREDDFARWYTDIVKKAELIDYGTVRGTMIIRPYGFSLWDNIKNHLDDRIKRTGHENVYLPLFMSESQLQKETDHVDGFAPEVAWITQVGNTTLEERLLIRPTSEVIFCEHFANIVHSYRDLPKLYNQWSNVVRWEKTTRPFLRSSEFLLQEGHTIHETMVEAEVETLRMLKEYVTLYEEILAIPIISGQKTEKEKFAGAQKTYTVESLMPDGKALQCATSHNFGNSFSKVFDIKFQTRNGRQDYVNQTSWGMSTRTLGSIIMVHGDDRGLVIPPKIAPVQVVIVPIAQHKEGVLDFAYKLLNNLEDNFKVKVDASDKMPGWKFNEYEMKGVPIRLEVGPRDIADNSVILVRRDTGGKMTVEQSQLHEKIADLLVDIQSNLFRRAKERLDNNTYTITTWGEFVAQVEKGGFIKAMWCGNIACEEKIKEETTATSRCISLDEEPIHNECICCRKEATELVYWARSY